MGKQGPCYHCGVTSTPLWRNGPPEKPVLCNACGSRWRTKGTLANYAPLHARAEPDDLEDLRVSRVRVMPINKQKEPKMLKRKQIADSMIVGAATSDNNQGFHWVMDEDTSNRSSSGSAISNSESCAQFGSADASDLTGPAQSVVWDSMVPSRKRTCVNRPKPSSVEKLTKDLYTILHEQRSYFSGSSEEDLLFESDIPMVSVEIGHGSVLIRHPSSIAREEESEASSLSFDIKAHPTNEAYSHCGALPLNFENKSVNFRSPEIKHMNPILDQGMQQEQVKRDKTQHEKLPILGFRNSPLRNVDLKDVLNFKDFIEHLTNEEQQRLLKYLPPVDSAKFPESLNNMFNSPQFLENLSSFQKLLEEGVLDSSISGVKREDCRTLKRLVLFDMKTSKWVEHYNMLKKCKNSTFASWTGGGFKGSTRNHMVDMKTLRDCQNQHVPEATATPTRNPIKVVIKKTSHENKQQPESDGSCFSPRSLFALPPDNSSLMLDSFQLIDESSDHDLLLEVPSNSSFPQAELLFPTTQQGSACSSSIYPPPP